MRAKKLLIWTWVGLVLLVFTQAARADSFFDILTPDEWRGNLDTGHVKTMTGNQWYEYMGQWETFLEEGEPYPLNTYSPPELYVYDGGGGMYGEFEYPQDGGLVMSWGKEGMPEGDYSAAWIYDYQLDPDLSNSTITITVFPPQFDPQTGNQINVVSCGMQDINGNIRAWYWNCGFGPGLIPWNVPTTITINTALTGGGAANPPAGAYANNPAFDITKVQFIIVDENFRWQGGVAVPPPGTVDPKPWNLWEKLSVNPNPVNPIAAGINIDIHQDINPAHTGGVLPNDFHIEGSIESGNPNDPAIPGSGQWSSPPVLTKHIDDLFPNFKYKIEPDPSKPGENWYKFVADWYGAEIPYCHILHLGVEFDVTCHNVIIDLVGWWTRDGQRLIPDPVGVGPGNRGFIPIPGFRVEDGVSVPPEPTGLPPQQFLVLRNGNDNGSPEEEVNVKIIQMDLAAVAPMEIKKMLGGDPLSQLRMGGMQEVLPWVPAMLNGERISPSNWYDFPAESFFDVSFQIEIPPPNNKPYLEHSIVVEPGGLLIARELLAFEGNDGVTQEQRWVWELHEAHSFDADLGDASDSTNSWNNTPMTAYPWGTPARFPTVYTWGSPPHGPIHWLPFQMAYLGNNVTMEFEADLPPDMDPTTNIIPPANQSDLDVADDGVLNIPLNLPHCIPVSFKYNVNIVNLPAGATLYANVWFDWDRSGDWNQTHSCNSLVPNAPEWAVQNQDVLAAIGMAAPPPGIYTIKTPRFLPWHPPGADRPLPIWMRITLSETPWVGSMPPTGGPPDAGSGPAGGYLYGETEDYLFIPRKICCIDCPDFNADGIVNMIDFAYFAAAWLKTCVIN